MTQEEFDFNGERHPYGTTSEEVEQILEMRHQTCSARRTDLRASGYTTYLVVKDVRVRRATSTGASAYVQIATPRGIAAIRDGIPLKLKEDDPTRGFHRGTPTSSQAFAQTPRSQDARRVLEVMVRFS
jgi:hypothetical protein